MAHEISLFGGKVKFKSLTELVRSCGTNRRDKKFLSRFESYEDMAAKLLPMYNTEEELVRVLKYNQKRFRTRKLMSSETKQGQFVSPLVRRETELLTFVGNALDYYLKTHPDALVGKDDIIINDVTLLTTNFPVMMKRFVSTIYHSKSKLDVV